MFDELRYRWELRKYLKAQPVVRRHTYEAKYRTAAYVMEVGQFPAPIIVLDTLLHPIPAPLRRNK